MSKATLKNEFGSTSKLEIFLYMALDVVLDVAVNVVMDVGFWRRF